jgi:hypothetical protein
MHIPSCCFSVLGSIIFNSLRTQFPHYHILKILFHAKLSSRLCFSSPNLIFYYTILIILFFITLFFIFPKAPINLKFFQMLNMTCNICFVCFSPIWKPSSPALPSLVYRTCNKGHADIMLFSVFNKGLCVCVCFFYMLSKSSLKSWWNI